MPLNRRLPKRGFNNIFRTEYAAVNLDDLLAAFEGQSAITLEDIYAKGLCKRSMPVKILGRGDVSAAVTVEAHRFSASAAEKLAKAGGEAKSLEGQSLESNAADAEEALLDLLPAGGLPSRNPCSRAWRGCQRHAGVLRQR